MERVTWTLQSLMIEPMNLLLARLSRFQGRLLMTGEFCNHYISKYAQMPIILSKL